MAAAESNTDRGTEFHFRESGPENVREPNSVIVDTVLQLGARVLAARDHLAVAQAELKTAEQEANKFVRDQKPAGAMLVGYCFEPGTFMHEAAQAALPHCD